MDKFNTYINLSKLSDTELKQVFDNLKTKTTCKGLKRKIDDFPAYLQRMKTFRTHNNVYLYICNKHSEMYTDDVYYKPNAKTQVNFETYKTLHF